MEARSGFELANRLRTDPATQTVPLVAVSEPTTMVATKDKTVFAWHVVKPIDIDELGAVVLEAVALSRGNAHAVRKAAGSPEVTVDLEDPTMTTPSPWLFQRIVEDMAEAVVVSDRNGVIVFWNRAAEAMFGHSAAEAMGQSLDLIIPERFRARHWAGYRAVMSSGVTRYGLELLAVPAVRSDGRRISIEFSIVLVRDPGGELIGAAAIIRDVTARWERERAARVGGG
jgi:PAS domain S-box-containing protein